MNKDLKLIVSLIGHDKLSGPLKLIAGTGRSARQQLSEMGAEQKKLTRQIADYDRQIAKTSGSVNHLWDAQKKLLTQQDELTRKIERQKKLMAIDARTGALKTAGGNMVSSGMSTLMWGSAAVAAPVFALARSAGEVEAMTNRLRVLGLGDGAVKDLRAYADAMNVAGSSTQDNLRYLVEAQGVFRESGAHTMAEQLAGAKLMAPLMAKLMTTSKALGHELSEDQERYFLRFVEQAGGVNDPHRAAELTNGLFRAIQSSGGNVDPSNYQAFLARAGTAGMKLSARSMFADFEPLIAELHESAGVGLQSAYSRANGMVKNNAAGAEFMRLGVWDKNAVELNSLGGIKRFIGGKNPLQADMASKLATDPVDFYIKLRQRYDQAGVKDVQRENMLLFGRTGGQLFNLIDKQLPTLLKSRQAYDRTEGLDTAYDQTKNSFFGQTGQMTAALKNLMVVAGTKGGLFDNLTAGVRTTTDVLRGLTAAANSHPTAFRWIATAATSLLGLKLAGAGAKVVFGGLLGPVAQLWGVWSKWRELGSIAAVFPQLTTAMGIARTAVMFLAQGVMRAGLLMLGNPVVLAIVAIGAAIGVCAYLVYANWGRIVAAFNSGIATLKGLLAGVGDWMKAIGSMMMQGLLIALNPVLLADKLLSIAKAGITAFKNYFGIKSPSRLFMEMGGHLTAGLAMGIDRGGRHPLGAISRLATGVAGASALALAAPTFAAPPMLGPARSANAPSQAPVAGAATHVTYSITIHAKGGASDDIADAVREAIAQIERDRRGRTFGDD